MPATKTVLDAVVTESRKELRLNNPNYRRVGLMLVDALDALKALADAEREEQAAGVTDQADRVPAAAEVRTRARPEKRSGKR